MRHYEPFDPDTVKRWFSVLVGMIQDDEKKVCFDWAICSLPWLILPYKKHTVTAEGFGIDELGEKLKTLMKN
jgi:hypothetical protein